MKLLGSYTDDRDIACKANVDAQETSGVGFSTVEQATGEHWTDGRPIYRKTILYGALPASSGTVGTVAHGVVDSGGDSDIDTCVDLYGVGYLSTKDMWMPLPYMSASATQSIAIRTSGLNIEFIVGMDRSAVTPNYIVIEYTRASDSAA